MGKHDNGTDDGTPYRVGISDVAMVTERSHIGLEPAIDNRKDKRNPRALRMFYSCENGEQENSVFNYFCIYLYTYFVSVLN